MGSVSLDSVKTYFINLLETMPEELLPQFTIWVDYKLAQYKVHGVVKRDNGTAEKFPLWISKAVNQELTTSLLGVNHSFLNPSTGVLFTPGQPRAHVSTRATSGGVITAAATPLTISSPKVPTGAAKRKMTATHADEPRVKLNCAGTTGGGLAVVVGGTTAEDVLFAKQPPPYPDHLTASTNGTESDDAPADLSMPGKDVMREIDSDREMDDASDKTDEPIKIAGNGQTANNNTESRKKTSAQQQCGLCDEQLPTVAKLTEHYEVVHQTAYVAPEDVVEEEDDPSPPSTPSTSTTPKNTIECFHCPMTFSTHAKRQQHLNDVHSSFKDGLGESSSRLSSGDPNAYQCPDCGEVYQDGASLRQHLGEQHQHFGYIRVDSSDGKIYLCCFCKVRYQHQSSCCNHVRTIHLGNTKKWQKLKAGEEVMRISRDDLERGMAPKVAKEATV